MSFGHTRRGHQIPLQMVMSQPPCGCWDLNSGPLGEHSVLLPTEPSSLQPLKHANLARDHSGTAKEDSTLAFVYSSPRPTPPHDPTVTTQGWFRLPGHTHSHSALFSAFVARIENCMIPLCLSCQQFIKVSSSRVKVLCFGHSVYLLTESHHPLPRSSGVRALGIWLGGEVG